MRAAEPPRDPVDVQNWFGTSLYGFENCGDGGAIIKQAYKDANKIVNLKGVKSDINWDSAAALEYLGPPGKKRIQGLLTGVHATTEEDDDHDQPIVRAYSQNPSSVSGLDWPYINFCPGFFGLPSLHTAVRQNSDQPAVKKYHVDSYRSTAGTFLHELFHLDLAADSVKGTPNPKVRDMKISYFFYDEKTGKRKLSELQGAYGATLAKVLARFVPSQGQESTGYYVQRNDDKLGRFALAKYIESKIGDYPFLPQIYQKLQRVHEPNPRPNSIGVLWDVENDSVAVLNLTVATLDGSVPDDNGVCPWGRAPNEDDFVVKAPHPDSAYPDWYHAQQEKWLAVVTDSLGSDTCSLNVTQAM
ncbi:hypothetical protein COL922a_010324 [Colletotrichum nupharicola]|nr:hypothetical protein COL922a_010324 [Colletotrichum nupharicola]